MIQIPRLSRINYRFKLSKFLLDLFWGCLAVGIVFVEPINNLTLNLGLNILCFFWCHKFMIKTTLLQIRIDFICLCFDFVSLFLHFQNRLIFLHKVLFGLDTFQHQLIIKNAKLFWIDEVFDVECNLINLFSILIF